MQPAVNNRSMLSEDFAPISKELRVVVLAPIVGFEPHPDVNVYAVWVLAPGSRCLGLRQVIPLTASARREQRSSGKQKDGVHCAHATCCITEPSGAVRCHQGPTPLARLRCQSQIL